MTSTIDLIKDGIPEPPAALAGEKYLEYVDGGWRKKPGVGRLDHETTTQAIYDLLRRFQAGRVVQHWTMLVADERVEPDVVLSHPYFVTAAGYLTSAPQLVVEVKSLGQTIDSLAKKCRSKYHPFGVPFCWIVDTDSRQGYEMHAGAEAPTEVSVLTAGSIRVPIAAIFEEAERV